MVSAVQPMMAYSWQRRYPGDGSDDFVLPSQQSQSEDDLRIHGTLDPWTADAYASQASHQGHLSPPHQSSDDPLSLGYCDSRQPQRRHLMMDTFAPSRVDHGLSRSRTIAQHQTGAPNANGITLISTQALPDRFRGIFPYPLLNAVQSKCFPHVYNTNDNFVLSSPTGSGKTVIFELAILRLINNTVEGTFKIVYQAPTKSLCAERFRDWQQKFAILNIHVAELTGNVHHAQLRNVQHAELIITTPEKWDSITRKWKDHKKLMQMVKLLLIDEVHMLKEDRGAVLEIVVSRMKSVGSDIRFLALSATIPNIDDVSSWLGRNGLRQDLPALQETFGDEFRPVRITKFVCGYASKGNDFAFDKTLNAKVPEVITKYSQGKPIMIFCFTRAACVDTAKALSSWYSSHNRLWPVNAAHLVCENVDLQGTVAAGVAFHHAGLSQSDRSTIEQAYLAGDINVICCTSTLAAGVNLPCHMVIIKNTVAYNRTSSTGSKEYSDLEIVQMLGRAGRPQFGDSAIAVVMTRQQKVQQYERLVSGQEVIESRLHLNLIDHLNAEISLGTIHDDESAANWLCSTFLFQRLMRHPQHYKLNKTRAGGRLEDHLRAICTNGISLLQHHNLVTNEAQLSPTPFGDAMSRYCVQFETMQTLLALKKGASVADILKALSHATEFKDIYFRSGEKALYRQWDTNPLIKFPLNIHVDAKWHKVYLILQVVLAGNELIIAHREQRQDFNLSKNYVFSHALRLTRCVVDCLAYTKDGIGLRNTIMLLRSLSAQIWDDSTLHMIQLEGLGIAGVRKLVRAGIGSIEQLGSAEPRHLEQVMSRNPPYGTQLQQRAKAFPRMSLKLTVITSTIKQGEYVALQITAKITFSHEPALPDLQHKAGQIFLLVDTAEGELLHFARHIATNLIREPLVSILVRLTRYTTIVRAEVSFEELAGTAATAAVNLDLARSSFAQDLIAESQPRGVSNDLDVPGDADRILLAETEDYLEDIDDHELMQREQVEVVDLVDQSLENQTLDVRSVAEVSVQLDNGKWACRHTCKDKTSCKHLCCREGLDKKPKPTKSASVSKVDSFDKPKGLQQSQLKLSRRSSTETKEPASRLTRKHTNSTAMQQKRTIAQNTHRPVSAKTLMRHDADCPPANYRIVDEENISMTRKPPSVSIQGTIDKRLYSGSRMSNHQQLNPTEVSIPEIDDVAPLHEASAREQQTQFSRGNGDQVYTSPPDAEKPYERSLEEALRIVREFLGDKHFTYVT